MADKPSPTLVIDLRDPRNLEDVRHWARVADALGFPSDSRVDVEGITFNGLRVTARLDDLP